MNLQGQRSASNRNNRCPLISRHERTLLPTTAERTLLPTTADRGTRIWPPGGRQLLLLLLLCGLQTSLGTAEVAIKIDFDLAPDSFDDQYQGCSKQVMEELSQGDYFTKEIDTYKNYSRIWQKAHLTWLSQAKSPLKNMTTTHAVAILVYVLNNNVSSDFSRAVASAATSPQKYKQSFHFKYLHYYLTSAIQLLRKEIVAKNDTLCYEVHHKMKDIHFKANIGATIRFGQFLSTSLLREEPQTFGSQKLFTIFTCLGAPLQDFSLKKEVLIPPYELFEVVNMSDHPKGEWLHLRSIGNMSTYNCQLLKASGKKCIPAPTAIVSLSFLATVTIFSKSRI